MTRSSILTRAALATALLACATPAAAQDAFSTRGLVLGAHVNTSALQLDEDGGSVAERGFGAGVLLGYGFNDRLAVFARANGSRIKSEVSADEEEYTYGLGIADLGLRYSFGTPGAQLRPYLEGGLSGTSVSVDFADVDGEDVNINLSGPGGFIGGGVEYFLNRAAALDAGMILGKGRLTDAEVEGEDVYGGEDLDFTTIRLAVGITFRP